MGGEPWMYFVPYQEDVGKALQELRQREFTAGRYYPAVMFLSDHLPIGTDSESPGAQHSSIWEARTAAAETGTQSILDMESVSRAPGFFRVCPMDDEALEGCFGTTRPTHEMIANSLSYFDDIQRGQGVYTIVYKDGDPSEIMFAGYSFD